MKTSVRATPDTCSRAGSSWPSTRYGVPHAVTHAGRPFLRPASLQTWLSDDFFLNVA